MTEPTSDWTVEYTGYDGREHTNHHRNRTAADMLRERAFLEEHGCWGISIIDDINPEEEDQP